MTSYVVRWEIDIEANSLEEAAKEALKIQRDPESEAIFFEVRRAAANRWQDVDLLKGDTNP